MNKFLASIALSMFCTENQVTAGTWEKLPPLPDGNGGFICGAVDNDIVVAGGTNWKEDTKRWLDRIWVFEPDRNAWRDAGKLPAPVAYAVCSQSKEGLWFAGGSSGTQAHTTLWLLDRKFSVTTVATLEQRFVYGTGAILDGKLHVIGGAEDAAKAETATKACYAIDLLTGKAKHISSLPVTSFIGGATVACKDRLFVFGGAEWDSASKSVANGTATFAYSARKDSWESIAPFPFATRGVAAVALDSRHILIAGGYKTGVDKFTDDAFIFDTEAGKYQKTTPLPYLAMVGLVQADDWVYVLGGEDRGKHRTDAVWRVRSKDLLSAAQPLSH